MRGSFFFPEYSVSAVFTCARIGDVILGDGPVKVITPLVGSTEAALLQELTAAQTSAADLIEWRTDYFETATQAGLTSAAMTLRSHAVKPILLTLRTANEGGELTITDEDYGELTRYFAASGFADAIDLEVKRGAAASVAAAHDAGLPVVMSYHNFQKTPSARTLTGLFDEMAAAGGDVLKIAVMPQTAEDVLRLMTASLKAREKHQKPVIAISMGALGRITRAAGALFGSAATFASLDTGSAPGQIDVAEMKHLLTLFAPR